MLHFMVTSLVTALSFAVLAADVAAAPKVALTAIENDPGGDVRDAVAAALDGKDLSVIGEKEVNRAVDRLGDVAELTEKDAKKLARQLDADAVVLGSLARSGGSKTLKFKLFVNGKKTKGFSVQFSNARSPKFKQALREKMVQKIGKASDDDEVAEKPKAKGKAKGKKVAQAEDDDEDPIGGGKAAKNDKKAKKADKADKKKDAKKKVAQADDDDDGEDDDEPKRKKAKKDKDKKADQKIDKKADKKKVAQADDEDGDGEGEGESDDDSEGDEPPARKGKRTAAVDDDELGEPALVARLEPKHSANRAAVRLDVGPSVVSRSLVFVQRPGFVQGPKPFRPAPVPGARFEVDMFPLAFVNPKGFVGGLGFHAAYDKTLVMNVGSMAAGRTTVDQHRYAVGGRFRLAFGKTATSPTMTLGGDYGRRVFRANRQALMDPEALDLPDIDYKILSPGLVFRFPIGRAIAFVLGGEGLLVTDAGPIQKAESYGRAKVYGVDAHGGLDVMLGNRFALRFKGEFTQIGYTFTGGGALSRNRDGNDGTQDVFGLADRSFGGAATLAVLY